MTAPARIPLAEIQRAVKAAKAVGGAGAHIAKQGMAEMTAEIQASIAIARAGKRK